MKTDLALLAASTMLAACGATTGATTDDTAKATGPMPGSWHLAAGECPSGLRRTTVNDPVRIHASSAEIADFTASKGALLADDAPLTLRVQNLLDQAFAQAQATYGDAAITPLTPPKASMVVDPRPGAFTLSAYVCYDVDVVANGGASVVDDTNWGFSNSGGVYRSSAEGPTCIRGDRDGVPPLKVVVDWLNAFGGACRVVLAEDGHLELGSGCAPGEAPRRMKHLAVALPTDRIALYTGRIWRHDEGAIAITLAHELGHYLQGHSGAVSAAPLSLERPYRHDQRPDTCPPPSDPSLSGLNDRMHALTATLDRRQPFPQSGIPLLNEAATAHFARYTYELEADEIGARLSTAAGIQVAAFRAGAFTDWQWQNDYFASEGVVATAVPTETPLAECRRLAEADWQDKGVPLVPNPADYHLPYLSFCFRLYNLEHVAVAAGYSAATPWVPPQAAPAWAELQAQAKNLDGGRLRGTDDLPLFERWR